MDEACTICEADPEANVDVEFRAALERIRNHFQDALDSHWEGKFEERRERC